MKESYEAKFERMKGGGVNPFIDPAGYKTYDADRQAVFRKEWERQKQAPPAAGQ
jgi:metallo-beta-lactamase class B